MRICFEAKTNKPYVMVNTAVFALKGGGTVTIDRDETEFTIVDGALTMEWNNCYLWEINGECIFDKPVRMNEYAARLFDGAELVSLELEDDADADYEVTDVKFYMEF